MIIAAASDTHGDTRGIERVLAYVRPAALIHLGDGERDAEYMAALFPGTKIIAVSGNCDLPKRNDTEKTIVLGGKKFFLTHGHLFGVKSGTERLTSHGAGLEADFVLYGHTHIPHIGMEAGMCVLNPGSAHIQGRNPTFAVIEIGTGVSVKILSLEHI